MSSTNKTEFLGLNSWVGADVPKREDFVNDNVILDNSINTHFKDESRHLNEDERTKWNSPFLIQHYSGNGAETNSITVADGFEANWGILFATCKAVSITDIPNLSNYNYFAVFTKGGSMDGVSFDGKTLTVSNSSGLNSNPELASYNNIAKDYCVIFAR